MLLNISVFAEMSSKDFEKSIFFSEFSLSRLFFSGYSAGKSSIRALQKTFIRESASADLRQMRFRLVKKICKTMSGANLSGRIPVLHSKTEFAQKSFEKR